MDMLYNAVAQAGGRCLFISRNEEDDMKSCSLSLLIIPRQQCTHVIVAPTCRSSCGPFMSLSKCVPMLMTIT